MLDCLLRIPGTCTMLAACPEPYGLRRGLSSLDVVASEAGSVAQSVGRELVGARRDGVDGKRMEILLEPDIEKTTDGSDITGCQQNKN